MSDNILVLTYNLNSIIRRLEKLNYEEVDCVINEKLKMINEKVYEISDAIEMIEVIIDDELL